MNFCSIRPFPHWWQSLGSVTGAKGETLETDLVRSWSRSTKNLCLPSRVYAKGFAVVSRVLQIGILRNELILSGKSMLLRSWSMWDSFLRFGFPVICKWRDSLIICCVKNLTNHVESLSALSDGLSCSAATKLRKWSLDLRVRAEISGVRKLVDHNKFALCLLRSLLA